ncbi:MAG: hypothetical protein H0V70_27130 [Ktedonobacteraceae bacterium]|nr:hypothetical protein [Ktedonobacteraceae bacterium]
MRRQRQAIDDKELELMVQDAKAMGMTLESAIQRVLEGLGGDKSYLQYRMSNPRLKTRPFNQVLAEDALATALVVWAVKQPK